MTPVVWSETAIEQLKAIRDYIALTSPVYAQRMVDRLIDRERHISAFPESGRHVPETTDPWVREVIEWPYRVIYRVHESRVEVLAVIHGRRADIGTIG